MTAPPQNANTRALGSTAADPTRTFDEATNARWPLRSLRRRSRRAYRFTGHAQAASAGALTLLVEHGNAQALSLMPAVHVRSGNHRAMRALLRHGDDATFAYDAGTVSRAGRAAFPP